MTVTYNYVKKLMKSFESVALNLRHYFIELKIYYYKFTLFHTSNLKYARL